MRSPTPLKSTAQKYYNQFQMLPFNQQLYQGTLPRPIFSHYLEQDSFYLKHYAKTVRYLIHVAPNNHSRDILTQFSQITHKHEIDQRNKHSFFHARHFAPSKSTLSYTNHLSISMQKGYEIGLAALYPCTLFYVELGYQSKIVQLPANHPYVHILNTYSNATYRRLGAELGALLVRSYDHADHHLRPQLEHAFCQSMKHECAFHEAVYLSSKEDNNKYYQSIQ